MVVDVRQPEAFGVEDEQRPRAVGQHRSTLHVRNTHELPAWPRHCWHLRASATRHRPAGWLAGGMFAWRSAAKPLARLDQLSVHELADRRDDLHVLDVRQPAEWASSHIDDTTFITGAELLERLDEVPDGPLAVICGSGYRSSVSASRIAATGRDDVVNVLGGMSAWKAAHLPTGT